MYEYKGMFQFGPVVSEMKIITYHQEDDDRPEVMIMNRSHVLAKHATLMSVIKDWLAWNRNNVSEWIDVYPAIPNFYRYISIISWQSVLLAGAKEHVTYSLSSLRVGRRLPDIKVACLAKKQKIPFFLVWIIYQTEDEHANHYWFGFSPKCITMKN
jgi:hypothetical protein